MLEWVSWNSFISPNNDSWRDSRSGRTSRTPTRAAAFIDVIPRHNRSTCSMRRRPSESSSLSGFKLSWSSTNSRVANSRNDIDTFGGHWLRCTTISIYSRNNLCWQLAIQKNRQVRNCFWDGKFLTTQPNLSGCATHEKEKQSGCKNGTSHNRFWSTSTSLQNLDLPCVHGVWKESKRRMSRNDRPIIADHDLPSHYRGSHFMDS